VIKKEEREIIGLAAANEHITVVKCTVIRMLSYTTEQTINDKSTQEKLVKYRPFVACEHRCH
jgi:hypothetical protein